MEKKDKKVEAGNLFSMNINEQMISNIAYNHIINYGTYSVNENPWNILFDNLEKLKLDINFFRAFVDSRIHNVTSIAGTVVGSTSNGTAYSVVQSLAPMDFNEFKKFSTKEEIIMKIISLSSDRL